MHLLAASTTWATIALAATGSDHPAVPPPSKGSAKALALTVSAEDSTACIKLRRLAASLAASPANKTEIFNLSTKTWLSYIFLLLSKQC